MAPVLVLYEVLAGSAPLPAASAEQGLNAFEALLPTDREVLLVDLLDFVRSSRVLSAGLLGQKYSFHAFLHGSYQLLPALTSVLPIRSDGTLRLRLEPGFGPPFAPKPHLESFLACSRLNAYDEREISFTRHRDASAVANEAATVEGGLQAFVSEDTAAKIAEATEAAKVAAKSLFSFASTLGKSVLDLANSSLASSVSLASSTHLSNGATVTVGTSKIIIQRQVAEGGFGTVYCAVLEASSTAAVQARFAGQEVAVKQLLCQSADQVEEAHLEIDVLKALQGHPGVVQLVDHCSIAMTTQHIHRQVVLLFPFFPRGTAWDAIHRVLYAPVPNPAADVVFNPALYPFHEHKVAFLGYHLASTLAYMHSKGYTHRDVKPHNVLLVDPETALEMQLGFGAPVLMDFGSAECVRQEILSKQAALDCEDAAARKTSLAYRAPELIAVPSPPCVITPAVDVWALGCTLFALAFGRSPFESSKEGVQKLGVLNAKFSFPTYRQTGGKDYSAGFKQLIQSTLQIDPSLRPDMVDVAKACQRLASVRG